MGFSVRTEIVRADALMTRMVPLSDYAEESKVPAGKSVPVRIAR
jgi:hypothetical protein